MKTNPSGNIISQIKWKFVIKNSLYFLLIFYILMIGSKGDKLSRDLMTFWTNIALLIIFCIFWIVVNEKKDLSKLNIEVLFSFFILIAIGVISTIVNNTFWKSINDIYFLGVALIIMLFFQVLRNSWKQKELLIPILVIGGLINTQKILVFILQVIRLYLSSAADFHLLLSFRGSSPNISAAFSNVIFLMAFSEIITNDKKEFRFGYFYLALTAFVTVLITGSRGGVIGLITGILTIIILFLCKKRKEINFMWKRYRIPIFSAFAIGILFFLIFVIVLNASGRIGRGLGIRIEFWRIALDRWIDNPWFGSGINTAGAGNLKAVPVPPGDIHSHAHNVFLNLLTEAGVFGLLFFLIFIFFIARSALKDYLDNFSAIGLGTFSLVFGFLAHGVVDTLYTEPNLFWLYMMIFGISISLRPIKRNIVIWMINIICVMILGVGIFLGVYKLKLNRIMVFAKQGEYLKAADGISDILSYSSNNGFVHQQAGLIISNLAQKENDEVKKEKLIDDAISQFIKAAEADPNWSNNHLNLGILYWMKSDRNNALSELSEAISLAPDSAIYKLNSGVIMEDLEMISSAEEKYQWIQEHRLYWADGPFWQKTTTRQKIYHLYQKQRLIERGFTPNSMYWRENQTAGFNARERVYIVESLIQQKLLSLAREELASAKLQSNSSEYQVEFAWIEASLLAGEGSYQAAVDLGKKAIKSWEAKSSKGPGGIGFKDYALKFYRCDSLEEDLVPFAMNAPLNNRWMERITQLKRWEKDLGTKQ